MDVPVGGRPHHDDDAFGASILNVLCDGVEGATLECDGRRLVVYQTGFFLAHSGVAADFASVLVLVLAAALVCAAGVFVVRLAAAVFVFATYGDEAGEWWMAIDYLRVCRRGRDCCMVVTPLWAVAPPAGLEK